MLRTSFRIKRLSQLMAASSVLTLLACGGGGGAASSKTLGGLAVDGYLQGATVFLDLNRNGTFDTGEPTTTTNTSGQYTLDYSSVTGSVTGLSVVVTGGVDSDTGLAFTGKISAPVDTAAQAQVVTPLTTLVDSMVTQGLAANVSAARQQLATALGLTVDQLATDPVAAIASNPGIYTTSVALQRAVQMLASANAQTGETAHQSQERVIRALAVAIRGQTSAINVSQLVAGLSLQNSAQARDLVSAITRSVQAGLDASGPDGAKAALKAMDVIRVRMESDGNYNLSTAATRIDTELGKTTSRPYTQLVQNSSSQAAITTISNLNRGTSTTVTQPANTTGRLLASNCFQCHGTGGMGGFDRIRGNASDLRNYLNQAANSSIMAAHAQGYTPSQLTAIVTYLQQ